MSGDTLNRANNIRIFPFRTEDKHDDTTPIKRTTHEFKRSYCLGNLTGVILVEYHRDMGCR